VLLLVYIAAPSASCQLFVRATVLYAAHYTTHYHTVQTQKLADIA
jgi:hypothetical protein